MLDAADNPVLEPAPGETPLWPTIVVRAHFSADAKASAIEQHLRARPELGALHDMRPHFEELADRAWEREWLLDFRPMRFGSRLWVCPGGQLADAADAVVVELDPGLAFGTGTHATTALCLEWLDSGADTWLRDADRDRLWLRLGDPRRRRAQAWRASCHSQWTSIRRRCSRREQNAERNAVLDRVRITDDRNVDGASADVLLANILAGPLIELAPLLAGRVRPRGRIALSGLLFEQARQWQRRISRGLISP